MKPKILTVASAVAIAAMAGSVSAATVFSDDFESPVITSTWQVYQTFGDWTATSGAGIEIQKTGAVSGVSAHSGTQYVELDSDTSRGGVSGSTNSSMTTKLNLGPGTYRVDWYYQPRTATAGDNIIEVFLAGASQSLFAKMIGSMSDVRTASTDWVKVSNFFKVDGTDNDYALTFRAAGTSNKLGGFIDDVSVSAVSAVPVPAAGFLLIGAIGGLAAFRRRKQAV